METNPSSPEESLRALIDLAKKEKIIELEVGTIKFKFHPAAFQPENTTTVIELTEEEILAKAQAQVERDLFWSVGGQA